MRGFLAGVVRKKLGLTLLWLYRIRSDHHRIGRACLHHAVPHRLFEQIVQRLDARLASAQKAGDLSFINREFKRRRQEAFAQGRPFLPYRTVQARLRQALSESRPAGRRRGSSSGCLNHRAIVLVNKFLGRRWDDESC